MDSRELLQKIIGIGEKPFLSEVTRSPWHPVIDVDSLNRVVKDKILQLIATCHEPDSPHCLVVVAPSGMGKTHLIAWTRERLERRADVAFIYVSPYRPQYGPLEQYLVNCAVDSLFRSYPAQQELVEERIRAILAGTYDELARDRRGRKMLGVRQGLWQFFRGEFPNLGGCGPDRQRSAISGVLSRPQFLDRAFENFCAQNPSYRTEARLDRDTFGAACYWTFGDRKQRLLADGWFQGESLSSHDRSALGFEHNFWEPGKIKHILWTFGCLVDRTLCLAFDQLEDTYRSFVESGHEEQELARMTNCLGELYPMPDLCFLFFWQMAIWNYACQKMDYHFQRRMLEGYGVQMLEDLTDENARELVKLRMNTYVWAPLHLEVPAGNPYFPFDERDIIDARRQSDGQIDVFIKKIRARYREILLGNAVDIPGDTQAAPAAPTQFRPLSAQPNWCYTPGRKAVAIIGERIPETAQVHFGPRQSPHVRCDPAAGRIWAVAPGGDCGKTHISLDTPNGQARLDFEYRKLPSPLQKYIDPNKMIQQRQNWAQKHGNTVGSQRDVGDRIGCSGQHIGNAEKGNSVADYVYFKMAELYGCPLEDFLREENGG